MKNLKSITLLFFILFSLSVSANHQPEFITGSIDIDTNELINGNVVLLNSETGEIETRGGSRNRFYDVDLDTLYYVVYGADDYNTDTDIVYFDSRIPFCTDESCTFQREQIITKCDMNYAQNAFECSVSDGTGTSYFVYDIEENDYKRVNYLKHFGKSDEFLINVRAENEDGMVDHIDSAIINGIKTSGRNAYFIVSSDTKYDLTIDQSGHEKFSQELYFDSDITACEGNCDHVSNGYETTCWNVASDRKKCEVSNGLVYYLDGNIEINFESILQKKQTQTINFKTGSLSATTDEMLQSDIAILGERESSVNTFDLPLNEVVTITHFANGYQNYVDFIYVDSGILSCNGSTCDVESNGFTTTGVFNNNENAWEFTVTDVNSISRSYVYDLDDNVVKRVVRMIPALRFEYDFITGVQDVDTGEMIEFLSVLTDSKNNIVRAEDDETSVAYDIELDTLYYITYSAENYGSETDVLYFDSGVPTCVNGDCEFESNGVSTSCSKNDAENALECSITDGTGTDYYVYDFDDSNFKRINYLKKNSAADQFNLLINGKNEANGVFFDDFTVTLGGITKSTNFEHGNEVHFIISPDTLYSAKISKNDGFGVFEDLAINYYLDSRLTTCGNACELEENEAGYSTSCSGSTCSVFKDGSEISNFVFDTGINAAWDTVSLKPIKADYYRFRTGALNEFNDEIDDITVEINGVSKQNDKPELTVPSNEAFGIKYTHKDYEDLNDFLYVDEKIITCGGNDCTLTSGEFTTTGTYNNNERAWEFTVSDDNGISRSFVYDNQGIIKRIVNMDVKDGADIIKPTFSNPMPAQDSLVTEEPFWITIDVTDNVGINEGSADLWLDGRYFNPIFENGQIKYLVDSNILLKGEHRVEVRIEDTNDNDASFDWEFNLDLRPNVDFTISPNPANINEFITFDASLSNDDGTIVSYVWDFGNGVQASGIEPEYLYSNSGNYDVTLTVTDDAGTSSQLTKTVVVLSTNQAPVAEAQADKTIVLVNENIQFDDDSFDPDGNIVSYFWDFGDGSTSTLAGPLYSYSQPGQYTAILTVTDNDGATNNDSITITVNAQANQPPIAVAKADKTTVRVNENIQFDATDSSDPEDDFLVYAWFFGDNKLSFSKTPIHSFDDEGIYNVTLTVTDTSLNVARQNIIITVVEDDFPIAIAKADKTTVKVGEVVNFDASESTDDGTIESYLWNFGDNTFSDKEQVGHTFTSPGGYIVSLTVTDESGQSSTSKIGITVTESEVSPTANAKGPYSGFVNEIINFDGSSSLGDIVKYQWTFGDGSVAEGSQVSHTYGNVGRFVVTLTVTDQNGLTHTSQTEANVDARIIAQPQPSKEKRELKISRISSLGGGIAYAGDVTSFKVKLENTGDLDLENVRIKAFIPELFVYDSTGTFDLDDGDSETKQLLLNVPGDAQSDSYLVKFSISQGGENIRTKYRYIFIE